METTINIYSENPIFLLILRKMLYLRFLRGSTEWKLQRKTFQMGCRLLHLFTRNDFLRRKKLENNSTNCCNFTNLEEYCQRLAGAVIAGQIIILHLKAVSVSLEVVNKIRLIREWALNWMNHYTVYRMTAVSQPVILAVSIITIFFFPPFCFLQIFSIKICYIWTIELLRRITGFLHFHLFTLFVSTKENIFHNQS